MLKVRRSSNIPKLWMLLTPSFYVTTSFQLQLLFEDKKCFMGAFDIIIGFKQVDNLIGLISFSIATVFATIIYIYNKKSNTIIRILEIANTPDKEQLAISLKDLYPSYKIPELNKKNGFEVVKLQLVAKNNQFKSKIKLVRLGMILFFLITCIFFTKDLLSITTTYGKNSPIIPGNNNKIEIRDSSLLYNN